MLRARRQTPRSSDDRSMEPLRVLNDAGRAWNPNSWRSGHGQPQPANQTPALPEVKTSGGSSVTSTSTPWWPAPGAEAHHGRSWRSGPREARRGRHVRGAGTEHGVVARIRADRGAGGVGRARWSEPGRAMQQDLPRSKVYQLLEPGPGGSPTTAHKKAAPMS